MRARAEEPVTVLTNPAGMTRLAGLRSRSGRRPATAPAVLPDAQTDGSGKQRRQRGRMVSWWRRLRSFEVTKDLRLGFGAFSNFGLSESWQSGWVGRLLRDEVDAHRSLVHAGGFLHVIAGLSLGATLNAMYGHLEYTSAINNSVQMDDDGSVVGDLEYLGLRRQRRASLRVQRAIPPRPHLYLSRRPQLLVTPVFQNVRLMGLGTGSSILA